MGAKGAVEIIFGGKDVEKRTLEYTDLFANPMVRTRSHAHHAVVDSFFLVRWREPVPFRHRAESAQQACGAHGSKRVCPPLSRPLPLRCRPHPRLQRAAERGFVDAIIDPKDTRRRLCEDLETLRTKEWTGLKKKHGNIPL
jgi:hypothetical protein